MWLCGPVAAAHDFIAPYSEATYRRPVEWRSGRRRGGVALLPAAFARATISAYRFTGNAAGSPSRWRRRPTHGVHPGGIALAPETLTDRVIGRSSANSRPSPSTSLDLRRWVPALARGPDAIDL